MNQVYSQILKKYNLKEILCSVNALKGLVSKAARFEEAVTCSMLIFKRCTSAPCIHQFCKGDSHLLQGVAFALKASILALRGPTPEEAPWLCSSVLTCYQPSCGWKILQTRAASVQESWGGHRLPCPCSWEKRAQMFDFQGTLPVWL